MIFGQDKTKVTITGSKADMDYYRDINIWKMNGEPMNVTKGNEHLGLVVYGTDEESKQY